MLSVGWALRVSTLTGGTGITPLPENAHPKKKNKPIRPIRDVFGWALGPHQSPSRSLADPLRSPSAMGLDGRSAGHDDLPFHKRRSAMAGKMRIPTPFSFLTSSNEGYIPSGKEASRGPQSRGGYGAIRIDPRVR